MKKDVINTYCFVPTLCRRLLKKAGIDSNKTYFELKENDRRVINELMYPRILKHRAKPSIGKYIKSISCPSCNGTRLNYKANAVNYLASA